MMSGQSLAERRVQRMFVAGVSPIALLIASGSAMAQDVTAQAAATPAPDTTATTKKTDDTPGIVVTGIRSSLTRARDVKRLSEVVQDSISAEDIGALPDRSVSEALQRIPGVTLQRTDDNRDPARLSAEGGGVFVRGLSWVRSEFNGRDIFSANNGHGLNFEDVSADLLSGVDVIKNPQADMVEGGIGGTVNLKTRKPLDEKKRIIALSGDYNYADLRDQGFWSGNAMYSNKWQIGQTELGILASASIGNVGNRTDSVQTGTYGAVTPTTTVGNMQAGQTYYIPSSLGWRSVNWTQKRTAYDFVVQFRPVHNLTLTAEAFFAKATPHDIEHAEGLYTLNSTDPSYKFNSQNVLVSGTNNNANIDLDTRVGDQDNITRDLSFKADWKADRHWHVTADVQHVTSSSRINSFTAYTEFGTPDSSYTSPNRPDVSFNLNGNTPSITTAYNNGYSLADQSNYWWAAAMDHIEYNTAGEWTQKADVEYSFDGDGPWGGFLQSLEFGVRHTDKSAVTRQTGYNWSLLSAEFWGGGTPVYLSGGSSTNELFSFNNFFGGKIATPGVGWFPSAALMSLGSVGAYNSFLKSTETAGWGWSPLTDASYASAVPGADNPQSGIYNQGEKTWAGYAMARFEAHDSPLGHFAGNIGLRIAHTSNASTGSLLINPITASATACVAANPNDPSACTFVNTATAFTAGGGTPVAGSYHNSYTDVLPSFNLRFFLQDKMLLRLAASKAIMRPTFEQMLPYTSLSFGFAGDGYSPALTNSISGVGGNPYLKPTQAWNFDVSWEYYWGRSNQLSAALFYKDVKDYIFQGALNESYTSNGVTQVFPVTRYMNGSHGTIKGLELDYQQFFDKLPGVFSGLGFQSNFTFVDATGGRNTAVNVFDSNQTTNAADQTLPLEGMSKYSFNLAGVYEKYGISARLAYNWRSRYLLTTSAANLNAPVWNESYGQLDASAMYQVTSFLKLGVQVTNLTKSPVYMDVGGATLAPRYSWNVSDRRIAFLARARL
jgi:TonB-dependent receptor